GIRVADVLEDDVLIYALFPQIGLKFLENRNNSDAFEPAPEVCKEVKKAPIAANTTTEIQGPESYTVTVNGKNYNVTVSQGGEIQQVVTGSAAPAEVAAAGEAIPAPLAGNIFKVKVALGQTINAGDVIMIMEAMKMETEIRAPRGGVIATIAAKEGEAVQVGDTLVVLN
ncbi:MAG: oxaloacetate decarboxylase, partial [Sedimenticola sp.]|nr:oxaloacetate decarboxylase [Sedimenticola sp.]